MKTFTFEARTDIKKFAGIAKHLFKQQGFVNKSAVGNFAIELLYEILVKNEIIEDVDTIETANVILTQLGIHGANTKSKRQMFLARQMESLGQEIEVPEIKPSGNVKTATFTKEMESFMTKKRVIPPGTFEIATARPNIPTVEEPKE